MIEVIIDGKCIYSHPLGADSDELPVALYRTLLMCQRLQSADPTLIIKNVDWQNVSSKLLRGLNSEEVSEDTIDSVVGEIKTSIENEEIEAVVGGGMVVLESDGTGAIQSVDIDDEALVQGTELLETLLLSGMAEIRRKVADNVTRRIAGLFLPDILE